MQIPRLVLILAILLGIAAGVGIYTFVYAKGASYFSSDPAACSNCHIMNEHFDAWTKSSHKSVAACNDCHTPHDFLGKYLTKAENGFWHSLGFTTGRFPDPLTIKASNRRITEQACRDCHTDVVAAMEAGSHALPSSDQDRRDEPEPLDGISCIRCHATVGHWVR